MELSFEEIQSLQQLGPERYRQRVIGLFISGRATAQHWQALGDALLFVSESASGDLVASIDRAVLHAPSVYVP